jgi:hypothetical protein
MMLALMTTDPSAKCTAADAYAGSGVVRMSSNTGERTLSLRLDGSKTRSESPRPNRTGKIN